MTALYEMIIEDNQTVFRLNIYGAMNADIKDRILQFPYPGIIMMHGLLTRDDALQKALEADILLIVQHADRRSITTMPFKTYDYLNTGKLVLGLVYRNNEIEELWGALWCEACQRLAAPEGLCGVGWKRVLGFGLAA